MSEPVSSGIRLIFETLGLALDVLAKAGEWTVEAARKYLSLLRRVALPAAVGSLLLAILTYIGLAWDLPWLWLPSILLLAVLAACVYLLAVPVLVLASEVEEFVKAKPLLITLAWFLWGALFLVLLLLIVPAGARLITLPAALVLGLLMAFSGERPNLGLVKAKVISVIVISSIVAVIKAEFPQTFQALGQFKQLADYRGRDLAQEKGEGLAGLKPIPVESVEGFDQLKFFGRDGESLIWVYRPHQGPCEFFPGPGHHPGTNDTLRPPDAQLKQECRYALQVVEQSQKQASAQEEARNREQQAKDRLSELQSLYDPGMGGGGIAAVILGDDTASRLIISELASAGIGLRMNFFREAFNGNYFDRAYQGDTRFLRDSGSLNHVNGVFLGKTASRCRESEIKVGMKRCEVTFDYVLLNKGGAILRSGTAKDYAAGFEEDEAVRSAVESLVKGKLVSVLSTAD